jgi:hypothetical protein
MSGVVLRCSKILVRTRQVGHYACVSPSADEPSIDELIAALEAGKAVESAPGRGVRIESSHAAPDPGDLTIAEPLIGADGEPWLFVEYVDDEGFGFDLEVGFGSEFTYTHDDAIEQAVEFLRSLPGVTSAFRQDPEQILINGTRDALRIRESLRSYFAKLR